MKALRILIVVAGTYASVAAGTAQTVDSTIDSSRGLIGMPLPAKQNDSLSRDTVPEKQLSAATNLATDISRPTLGGNLPKVMKARPEPYIVTADIYVPSGKTVVIEPGTVLLFSNFTGLHVEGRLVAEATADKPIVFSSVFDQAYNLHSPMHPNSYDWDGIYIHESGIGSTMSSCKIMYSVYGVRSLTKYIRFNDVVFQNNGRSDLTIEGVNLPVTEKPYSYALTIADARKDGVPVKILMDPMGKKRTMLRYGGLGLLAGGCVTGIWCSVAAAGDSKTVNNLKDTQVKDINSNLIKNSSADYNKAIDSKNTNQALAVTGFVLAILAAGGLSLSFTF